MSRVRVCGVCCNGALGLGSPLIPSQLRLPRVSLSWQSCLQNGTCVADQAMGFCTVCGAFFAFNDVGFGCALTGLAGSTVCIYCWLLLLPDPPL